MPIFKYYNPYRRPIFYNSYRPTYERNYIPPNSINCPPRTKPSLQSIEDSPTPKQNHSNHKLDDNVWLDLFGIKLYFDDVLILSLLFFLYQEEVKDEGLFLALILLLIS